MHEHTEAEEVLLSLAHTQDELWVRDSALFKTGGLDVPCAYIIWTYRQDADVERIPLGPTPAAWPVEIVTESARRGGNPTAVVTLGLGTMLNLPPSEENAQILMSLSAGLKPADVANSREHLISHLKTTAQSMPNRVMGAPIESDGTLGQLLDSGFDSPIVEGVQ